MGDARALAIHQFQASWQMYVDEGMDLQTAKHKTLVDYRQRYGLKMDHWPELGRDE
jgi:hypothetical protein